MKKLALLLALVMALSCVSGIALAEEETVKLQWMYPLGDGFQVVDSMSENPTIQMANAANNVEVEFIHPPVGQETEQYNLMLTGDELPDIITHGWGMPSNFPGGADVAIEDEYFLDMKELIAEYAPNYQAILDTNDVVRKAVTTDSGYVWSMCMVDLTAQPQWDGPTIRVDIWEKYDLAVPVTIEDWYNGLKTIKEGESATNPDFIAPLWVVSLTNTFNEFLGSFNADNTFQLNADGEVVFGPITDNYKAYLTEMHKWYEEDLIQEDFAASGWSGAEPFQSGKTAAMTSCGFWNFDSWTANAQQTNPDFEMSSVPYPQWVEGELPKIGYTATQARGYDTVVTCDCETPERAVAYLDWFYSEDAFMQANWGVEGEDYIVQEDGTYKYTDLIVNNPEGVSMAIMNFKRLFSHGAFLRDWERENGSYGEASNACHPTWGNSATDEWMMPTTLTMTADEGSAFNVIMNDINTYVAENTTAFVTGERSLDEWDAYVQQIMDMNLEEALEIEAAAYTRWTER